jgi:hypothetical protein
MIKILRKGELPFCPVDKESRLLQNTGIFPSNDMTSQKKVKFVLTTVRTSNVAKSNFVVNASLTDGLTCSYCNVFGY